jgi:mRNA interferase MazF
MATFERSSIVLVHFPFSDLSQTKLRPAVVLSQTTKYDCILCQITSNANVDEKAIEIGARDFAEGSLQKTSYARPNKIFTAHEKLLLKRVGILKAEKTGEIVESIIRLLKTT